MPVLEQRQGALEFSIFKPFPELQCAVSMTGHGDMRIPLDGSPEPVRERRRQFLAEVGLSVPEAQLPWVVASELSHGDRIVEVGPEGRVEVAANGLPQGDILVSRHPNLLFHTLADCLGLCMYDPRRGAIALAHAGYKGVDIGVPIKTVRYLAERYGSDPADLLCALTPSLQGDSFRFEYLGGPLREVEWTPYIDQVAGGYRIRWVDYAVDQLLRAGVNPQNIERSPINTATSQEFYSHHRWATSGKVGPDRRHAVVLALR